MKNNKGIGKFELLTMIVIFMIAVVLVLWYFIGVANKERYTTMKKDAVNFNKTIVANIASFHNTEIAYLGEAVTVGFLSAIKSPFSGKDCSLSESKVDMNEGKPKTTLRCDDYLIDDFRITTSYEDIPLYKVSAWTEKKPKTNKKAKLEKKVLYNCLDGGKEKYKDYVEELYFVSLINNDYGSDHYRASTIKNECVVVTKTLYRTKKLIK